MKKITSNSYSYTPVFNTDGVNSVTATESATTTDKRSKRRTNKRHAWVTVVNPNNSRSLLQACDDCGVVKTENSLIRSCRARHGQGVISSSMNTSALLAI